MNNRIAKYNRKKQRQATTEFVGFLLSNMTFKDRIKFVFTGNYYIALQRVLERMKVKQ